jgi:hypothetical protein
VPAWITIYLQAEPRDLSTAAIREGIADADWWTLGEDLDLDDDEVDAFMAALEWHDHPLELRHEGRRPVQFHVWTDPARLREEVDELDQIEGQLVPPSVREHLRSIRAIVALEMGFTQLETMFEVVGFEVAYWLAETYRGVIKGPSDAWFDHDTHRWDPIEH